MLRPTPTRVLPALLLAAGGAALAFAAPPRTGSAERYTLTGEDVALYNLAGEVHIHATSGDRVVVDVERGGRDATRLEVATGPIGSRQTLRVRYPGDRVSYPSRSGNWRTEVRVRDDGTFGDDSRRIPGVGRKVHVTSSSSGLDAHADLDIGVPAGTRLAMHLAAGDIDVANVDGQIQVHTHTGRVNAKDVKGGLLVDTGSGSVDVSGVAGDLDVDTGSGSVRVEEVKGGMLKVDTGSGGVDVTDARVDDLRVDTGSGHVELSEIHAGDILVDTGSGGVTVDLSSDVANLTVDTGSGGVTLYVPRNLGADFQVGTGGGNIRVDVPHQTRHVERNEARGRIGDGRGRIRVDTGSGSVQIRPRATGGSSHGAAIGRLLGRFE
jgi:lia operon protein LiaG